ncbi:MAG: hypothetical protein LBG81_00025 [Coriobacteriaceae bacterium]|jgi:hypothetical protein|nr:hypothetical protein [Coriobacteriaceae bacterium]
MAEEFRLLNRNNNANKISGQLAPNQVDTSKSTITTTQHQKKMRRMRRSEELMEAMRQIDVQSDPAMKKAIMEWVESEYDKRGGGKLIGLFGKCYLGHPYCDHRMDLSGSIIEHFKADDPVPPPYKEARAYAASSAYAFIEVYDDGEVIPVHNDGKV